MQDTIVLLFEELVEVAMMAMMPFDVLYCNSVFSSKWARVWGRSLDEGWIIGDGFIKFDQFIRKRVHMRGS